VLGHVHHGLVKGPEPLERRGSHEHAVELDLSAGCPREVLTHLVEALAREAVALEEAPALRALLDARVARRHVDLLAIGLSDQVERPDHPRPCLLGTLDHSLEPAGCGDGVVVDEDDVARSDPAEANVPRLVRHEVALGADELEAAATRLCGEVTPDPGGRSPVDVDQPEGPGRARVEGFERAAGDAESLPGNDDDGDERLAHSRNRHRKIMS